MICPHCKENVLHKERGGHKCSKCRKEFAFDPKTDVLGLHDIKFQKAIDKLSSGGKLFFTSGQLAYFLSRKSVKNSFHFFRGLVIALTVILIIFSIVMLSITGWYFFLALAFVCGIIGTVTGLFIWNIEGNLSLPVFNVENDILKRWFYIYGKNPTNIITNFSLQQNTGVIGQVRGVLVCPEQEILVCLAANRAPENLGLVLCNPFSSSQDERSKLDFMRQRRDLPIFVLHDASVEGCLLKNHFIAQFFDNDQSRNVIDIGLRPKMTMHSKMLRLRDKSQTFALQQLPDLTAEETAWLQAGNYTPLLALTPGQLINFVHSAVLRNYQRLGQQAKVSNEAHAVGFMTWVGQTK